MDEKNFEKKKNIKTVISMQQCTAVPNFSQFEKLQIMGPSLTKTHQ